MVMSLFSPSFIDPHTGFSINKKNLLEKSKKDERFLKYSLQLQQREKEENESPVAPSYRGRTSDTIGRKWGLAIGAIVFQVGGFIMTIAPSFLILMIGRLLAGIGIGFGAPIVGIYIAEISPAILRGFLTSFPEILITVESFLVTSPTICFQVCLPI
ncbi:hypothetical protein Cgig2_009661 [Carnegiea gigantea]|uniref:Major facilitator superfamily (MFS) profile domain-containing protein n=1 Tax=Carnegiea gigantea TaxID=171969 RepID=A0A9Q1GJM3_9CARY|nr:hypothetical protein Cgig2_009661 [Carnegiea gigantea]